jgi:crotonobetainyl-CoA:carnitine CoA-transferase CaiB-like acyl-CoA transferase
MSARPLAGLSVLAAEQMHSLPHATQLLALLGAQVIKVEPLAGESGRGANPALVERDGSRTGSTFVRNNLGKASVALDLKRAEGRELFLRLAATVDAVAENFRPGTADRLGIGWEAVRAVNPAVVYVSVSGFGNRSRPPSPYREWPAYAPIVEGMAGLYEYTRRDDAPPRPALAGALGDTAAGLYAVIGLLAALRERERSGVGSYVDVSMYDAMVAVADVVHPHSMGVEPAQAIDGIGILHAFRACDGWFIVEVVREPHFARLARAVGRPEWLADERLATRAGWGAHVEDLIRPAIEAWAAGRSRLVAAGELARQGIAAGPVNQPADILADPHVRARRFVHELPTPDGRASVRVVGNPIAFAPDDGAGEPSGWPLLGDDTERVLAARLGLDRAALDELRAQRVIA